MYNDNNFTPLLLFNNRSDKCYKIIKIYIDAFVNELKCFDFILNIRYKGLKVPIQKFDKHIHSKCNAYTIMKLIEHKFQWSIMLIQGYLKFNTFYSKHFRSYLQIKLLSSSLTHTTLKPCPLQEIIKMHSIPVLILVVLLIIFVLQKCI